MATKARSLKIACPFCLEAESVTLNLNDLAACACGSCNEEFSPQQAYEKAAELAARWASVVAWIDNAPVA